MTGVGRKTKGYTLMEMLVVMAIITIIAGLVLPGIWAAKERAHQATCINNLRQLGLAFQMYMQENRMYLPPENAGGIGWDQKMYPYIQAEWATKKSELVMCPKYINDHYEYTQNPGAPLMTTYGMSGNWARNKGLPPVSTSLGFHKASYHKRWETTILLGPVRRTAPDVSEWGACIPASIAPNWDNADTERHRANRANYLLLDGHVQSFTLQQTLAGNMWYANQ